MLAGWIRATCVRVRCEARLGKRPRYRYRYYVWQAAPDGSRELLRTVSSRGRCGRSEVLRGMGNVLDMFYVQRFATIARLENVW